MKMYGLLNAQKISNTFRGICICCLPLAQEGIDARLAVSLHSVQIQYILHSILQFHAHHDS